MRASSRKERRMKEREQMIRFMCRIANKLVCDGFKNNTWRANRKLWRMCSDWNSTHDSREEIFMCETSDDDNNVNGFMIEDEVFYWQEV